MIREHERVVLTASLPKERLETGDVVTVVHVYDDGEAFESEFTSLDGCTAAVATVEASGVRPVTSREITTRAR
jgi:hypothetical protein